MLLKDIQKFTKKGSYQVNIHLNHIKKTLEDYEKDYGLELNPDFQRGHVWTEEQQIAWLEFYFKSDGNMSSNVIYFNSPAFQPIKPDNTDLSDTILCVDGLQRLTAMLKLLDNKIKIFGYYLNEFEDSNLLIKRMSLVFNINNLTHKKELLKWYLEMNTGGTVHAESEIVRVKAMLAELEYVEYPDKDNINTDKILMLLITAQNALAELNNIIIQDKHYNADYVLQDDDIA